MSNIKKMKKDDLIRLVQQLEDKVSRITGINSDLSRWHEQEVARRERAEDRAGALEGRLRDARVHEERLSVEIDTLNRRLSTLGTLAYEGVQPTVFLACARSVIWGTSIESEVGALSGSIGDVASAAPVSSGVEFRYKVELMDVGSKKISTIKAIREAFRLVTGKALGLREAKEMSETPGITMFSDVSGGTVDDIRSTFSIGGSDAELKIVQIN